MTKAELVCRHFAECYRRLIDSSPDVRATAEKLAIAAADPTEPTPIRAEAISTLATLLFPSPAQEESFADRVYRLIRERRITQRKLAEAIGVTQPVISEMLSGKHRPQRQTVVRIAKALSVHPAELHPSCANIS